MSGASRAARGRREDRPGLGAALGGRAIGGRLLPAIVAAMSLLAALAMGGVVGAAGLAERWLSGSARLLTVQVPQPSDPSPAPLSSTPVSPQSATSRPAAPPPTRLAAVQALLTASPIVASQRRLAEDEMRRLLAPWLGDTVSLQALPLPAVLQVRLAPRASGDEDRDAGAGAVPVGLARDIAAAAPGTLIEANAVWGVRLFRLADSLQGCAALALLLVGLVAAGVVALAARAGLQARRQAVEIVHGLGAGPGAIASRFARAAARLGLLGGCLGTLAALPILIALARLSAPFSLRGTASVWPGSWTPGALAMAVWTSLPVTLWTVLPLLPLAAALIGWGTAQATVRAWLRRL